MRNWKVLAVLAALLVMPACAPKSVGTLALHDRTKSVKTVYVWDADGHTDLKLLRGLKYEAESRLSAGGYIVSRDPNATEAYVKITVDDALPGDGGFIMARLYIIDAADKAVIYDKTCEVGSGADGYPITGFVGCALAEFLGGTGAK